MTPFSLAFPETYSYGLMIFDTIMNFLFLIDIFLRFITVYYDDDYNLIDDRWVTLFINNIL